MVIQCSFWHVFGFSVESVEAQPIYGHKYGESNENSIIYFFDGFIINIPFCKIMLGDVYGFAED